MELKSGEYSDSYSRWAPCCSASVARPSTLWAGRLPSTTTPPWTNGQVERVNRTIKEAIIERFRCNLNKHLHAFLPAYNHAKRCKTLHGLIPNKLVCAQWQKPSTIFTCIPTHLTLGLYT